MNTTTLIRLLLVWLQLCFHFKHNTTQQSVTLPLGNSHVTLTTPSLEVVYHYLASTYSGQSAEMPVFTHFNPVQDTPNTIGAKSEFFCMTIFLF